MRSPSRSSALWVLALLIGLGTAGRLAPWKNVFTAAGVELLPADSHYYVRFAKLQIASFPHFTQFDPWVNFPDNARIIWPPLHALIVAGVVRGGEAGGLAAEAAAAWVDPLVALTWLIGLSALALRLRGGSFAIGFIGVLALTPASVWGSSLGNADHHVHEFFLSALLLLLLVELLRTKSVGGAVIVGVVAALARTLTTIAGIYVPIVAVGYLTAAALTRERGWPRLAALTGASFALAEAGVALALGNLSLLDYELIGGFRVLFGIAVFSSVAAASGWLVNDRRWAWALAPAALSTLAVGPELQRAFMHLAARDPLLGLVAESRPLLADPRGALAFVGALLALLPFAALVAMAARRAPGRPFSSPTHVAWAVVTVSFALSTALALLQNRFLQPWTGVAAMAVGLGVERLKDLDERSPLSRLGVPAMIAVCVAATIPLLVPDPLRPPRFLRVREALTWTREHADQKAQSAVLSEYLYGHWVNLWAEQPAVASTFSQLPWHLAANERAYAILRAKDEDAAYALCRSSRVGIVLATHDARNLGAADPREVPALLVRLREPLTRHGWTHSFRVHARFRLLHEAPSAELRSLSRPQARVYEVVEGAMLQGACPPGAPVLLEGAGRVDGNPLTLMTSAGRCPGDGTFRVRVAQPGWYELWPFGRALVSENDVRVGAPKALSLETAGVVLEE